MPAFSGTTLSVGPMTSPLAANPVQELDRGAVLLNQSLGLLRSRRTNHLTSAYYLLRLKSSRHRPRHLPGTRFARYADDAVLHCKSKRQAEYVLDRIRERFQACKLELHPGKTRIVYCKDINRTGDYPDIQFTFLGYTFRPRKAVDKYGRVYVNFSPAVSRDALKTMRQTIRGWHLQLKSDKSLADLSAMFAPILKGWQQYYGHFHGSALKPVWRNMNLFLLRWLMRKHKTLAGHKTRAAETLKRLAQNQPRAFVHWSLGYLS